MKTIPRIIGVLAFAASVRAEEGGIVPQDYGLQIWTLVTFLVLLLITANLGSVQEAETITSSGGFQLEATVFGSQLRRGNLGR